MRLPLTVNAQTKGIEKRLIIMSCRFDLIAKLYVLMWSYVKHLEVLILHYSLRSYMKQ